MACRFCGSADTTVLPDNNFELYVHCYRCGCSYMENGKSPDLAWRPQTVEAKNVKGEKE